ncbi:OmpP1/FadL family transporter [Ancylomarina longa]|nr:outer membrane protein transport protein [Ancylomarina longa]
MIKKVFLAIAIIVLAYNVKAEGFAVNLQGNKQVGMGHVGTALNFDASSMQWNPGALATLDQKYSFSVGGFATLIKTEYTGALGKEETDNPTGTPFYLYGSVKVSNKLAIGLGVYTPFGNKVDWGKDWSGKYLIQNIELKAIYIQPTISYQLADWISVGAGLNIVYGEFTLNKEFPIRNPADGSFITNGGVELSGNKIKYGYNLGVFLQPTEKFNIGLSYRSQVDIDLDYSDGDAKFSNIPAAFAPVFPDGGVAATLPMPASFNIGLAYQIDNKWLVSADVNFVQWNKYKSLDFDFENDPTGMLDSKSPRNWDNTMIYRIGAQYSANSKLDLRAGFYYDETPAQKDFYTPETPGANKIGVSTGFSYKFTNKLSLDASLLYINGEKTKATDSTTGFSGEYKNTGWIPGIGVTYNF